MGTCLMFATLVTTWSEHAAAMAFGDNTVTNSFDEFVNRQNQIAEAEQSVDWTAELDEWRDYLEQFKNSVVEFLQEYVEQRKVQLKCKTKKITEDKIGSYDVQAITIKIGNTKVELEPIGTLLIGSKGRVDMKGPKGTVKIVLVPKDAKAADIRVQLLSHGRKRQTEKEERTTTEWAWKLTTPPPNIRYTELKKESFHTAIMEVVNG